MKKQENGDLKRWQKIFYGMGDITPTLPNTVIGFLYVFFLDQCCWPKRMDGWGGFFNWFYLGRCY